MEVLNFNVFVALYFMHIALAQNIDVIDQARSSRILFGNNARIEDFPYYAGLAGCGAAILSKDWVVTAAHCVPSIVIPGQNIIWVGGETYANSLRVVYDKVIIHPDADIDVGKIPQNDIALLHLAKPLRFTKKINAIALPRNVSADPMHVFVGRGKDESGQLSRTVKTMETIRLSTNECFNLIPQQYQAWIKPQLERLAKVIICAKRPENKPGVCNGDSGSPLVQKNTLIGLASFIGNTDCSDVRLGFYVNVATFVPWIKSVTSLS